MKPCILKPRAQYQIKENVKRQIGMIISNRWTIKLIQPQLNSNSSTNWQSLQSVCSQVCFSWYLHNRNGYQSIGQRIHSEQLHLSEKPLELAGLHCDKFWIPDNIH